MGGLLFLLVMAGFFYVFLVRPQQKRVKQHTNLVGSLTVGDEVVTAGGIVGIVNRINDRDVLLEVAPNVELRVVKGAIAQKKPEEAEKTE
jgi:preprotein translocase subunit YajC